MRTLPAELVTLLLPFAPLFSTPVFQHMQTLVAGAILTIGPRTVAAVLRAVGLSHTRHFQNYHRVLNRCHWQGLDYLSVGLSMCNIISCTLHIYTTSNFAALEVAKRIRDIETVTLFRT